MSASNAFSVFISILAFLASLTSIWYSLRYAKANVFHSIQKMMLDKSNECNDIFKQSVLEYQTQPSYIGQERKTGFNYMTTIDEIIKSNQLLVNALAEYKESNKLEFFLEQFWIQLDNRIRRNIIEHKSNSIKGKRDKDMEEVFEIFQFVFDKYKQ